MANVPAHPAYAIAGSGTADLEGAAALLEDFLPLKLGELYRPRRIPRQLPTLPGLIDWLEGPDMLGDHGTVPSDDLVADLARWREDQEGAVTLIMLWPDEPDDAEKDLVTRARAAGIRVVSLGDAVNDLLWEPEPEPEAEAEPPAQAVPDAATVLPQEIVDLWSQFRSAFEALVTDIAVRYATRTPEASPARLASKSDVDKVAARLAGDAGPSEARPESAPFGPPFQHDGSGDTRQGPPERVAYYMNPDGQYRRVKGRPRKDEERVLLTLDEVDALVREGHITDN